MTNEKKENAKGRLLKTPLIVPCEGCGKMFEQWAPRRILTCSDECRKKVSRRTKSDRFQCEREGKVFQRPTFKPAVRICELCGKSFISAGGTIRSTCSDACALRLKGDLTRRYRRLFPVAWYNATCLICGKEFKVTKRLLAKKEKVCSPKCFKILCQDNSFVLPLFSEEAYKIISAKALANPKPGHFVINFNSRDYSLLSPDGGVFVFRNMNYFVRHNLEMFASIFGGKEKIKFPIVYNELSKLMPGRQQTREAWCGWRWHDLMVGPQPMRKVILSLGSNIEPRRDWIEKAVQEIAALPDISDLRLSPLYETSPEEVPEEFRDQPFLNGIVLFEACVRCPRKFLKTLQAIEDRLGRTRGVPPGSPRTIDIDIIDIEKMRVLRPELIVPHLRAATRRFVLQPLVDLLPDHRFFGHDKTVSELFHQITG